MPIVFESHGLALAQYTVALLFLWSATAKILAPRAFVVGVGRYKILPSSLVRPFGLLTILAEFAISASHLTGRWPSIGATLGLGLLTVFGLAVADRLSKGHSIPCSCFPGGSELVSNAVLLRIIFLAAIEALLLVLTDQPRSAVSVAAWLVLVGETLLVIQLIILSLGAPDLVALARRQLSTDVQ